MDIEMDTSSERKIIDALKMLMTHNFIGKSIRLRDSHREYNGIVLDETKRTFYVMCNNRTLSLLKSSVEVYVSEFDVWVPAKYLDSMENRFMRKVKFRDNPLL